MALTQNINKQQVADGIDMRTMQTVSHLHPSLADGCNPVAIATGLTAQGSPGAVLGTGANPDIYTPGIEGA